jgi:cell division protein FtsI/penicillin-binding protein 2
MTSNLSRIRIISIAILIFALILLSRLYFVQVIYGGEYSDKAERQYSRPNKSLFDRGSIFFEDKDGDLISAATLKSGFVIAINPRILENPEEVYEKVNAIIEIDSESFFLRAFKKDDPYEEIAKRVPEDKAKQIDELGVEGLDIFKERWRFYPGFDVGSQALGFIGYKGDELAGRYGLERYYNDVLERSANDLQINFFAEVFSNITESLGKDSLREKGDIVTSIEPTVQTYIQGVVEDIQEEWDSKLSAGVVINPKTGEIYAMAVTPSFDLNDFSNVEDPKIFANPIVEDVYEMGSIIKPLTMAAGLDSGAVTAETVYNDKGFLELDGYTISNYDGKGRGVVNMQEVLSQSLNTGVAFVVSQIGNDEFAEYMRDYGLEEETNIDLPNETTSLVDNLDSPRDIEYATASYGQGIALTPMITIRALSSLAGGGILPNPHLVKKINYKIGTSKTIEMGEGRRVLKKETADEITRMLIKVVDDALLGGTVALPNYSIAAKTGTAQIANPDKGGYYDDRYLHSFFGYFPAYNPKFLIFLYTIHPKKVRFASQTLTHPFMDMTNFLINYYEIPPDR